MAIIESDDKLKNKATDRDYTSQFRPYSLGTVTAHKDPHSELIDVTPIEILFANNGEIINNYQEQRVRGLNKQGEEVNYSVITSNNITAAWLPIGNSNRISPPELRRGMIVMIYVDGDNKYYWQDLGLNREYMRAETATYAFCANPNPNENKAVAQDSWYVVEVSPRNHQLILTTSKDNQEYTTYSISLNTKEGVLKITDGEGNFIMMDSRNVQHRLENQKGTFIEMLGEDITLSAPRNIKVVAGKDISFEAGNKIDVKSGSETEFNAGGNYNITTGGNCDIIASGNYTVTSVTYSLTGTGGGGKSVGDLKIEGNATISNHVRSDTIATGGNIHAGGNITADGNIDCKH
jgi:uncharacterized protein (DUF2345 family)